MKVKTVAVCYGRKFNLGDYNSLNLEVTLWADLEEGDSPDDVTGALQGKARDAVRREYSRLRPSVQPGQAVEGKANVAVI